ncbi:MAG: methyltransferase domain-containing protein [Candidatus Heimdallarchaeota archaeon]|nr:methyltransferase domain-containing protein [Candidatus Heimdallarchaeota archaeon]
MKQKNSIPFGSSDLKKWYQNLAKQFFRSIGLKKGQSVLDFGCRVGNYSIPAALFVGSRGKLYALDKDHGAIDELMKRTEYFSLQNIIPMKTSGELNIDLPDNSVDFILFYDIIYSLYKAGGLASFKTILVEFDRILRKGGKFSFLIEHIQSLPITEEDLITEVSAFFTLENVFKLKLMHWNHLETGKIHQFKK